MLVARASMLSRIATRSNDISLSEAVGSIVSLATRATPSSGQIRNPGFITSAAIGVMAAQRLGPTCAKRIPRLLAFEQRNTKNIRKGHGGRGRGRLLKTTPVTCGLIGEAQGKPGPRGSSRAVLPNPRVYRPDS